MKKPWLVAISFLVLLGAALAGPTDNSLLIGSSQEPRVLGGDFLLVISNQSIKGEVEDWLFAGLYEVNAEGQNVAGLVTEIPTADNRRLRLTDVGQGKKRLELDLTLRNNIRWSDGQPITTDDVAFFYEVGKAKGMAVGNPDVWARLGLRVRDKQNFTVIFEPATFIDMIGAPIGYAPSHIMRPEWEKVKVAAARLDENKDAQQLNELYTNFFSQFATPQAINAGRMVFSGAFTVRRWISNSTLELQRNPNFYLTPPGGADKYVQRVVYRFIRDTNALQIALIGGSLDASSLATGLTFDQARSKQLVSRAPGRFDIWFVPSDTLERIELNNFASVARVKELGLDDRRTRVALAHALNREAWVRAFFDGLEPVAHTFINPVNPNSNSNVTKYLYNPDRARQLLAELGWRPGPDGILQRTVGGKNVRFELEFVTTAGNAIRERSQQFFIDNLRAVGIAVKTANAPSAVVFNADFIARAVDDKWHFFMYANTYSLGNGANEYLCKDLTTGIDNLSTRANNYAGANISGWCNAEYDKVRAQAVLEFDARKRKALFDEMQKIWVEDLPSIPLRYRTNPYVVRKGVVNLVASTYTGGYGGPFGRFNWQPHLVGWESRGAQKQLDQSKYALSIK